MAASEKAKASGGAASAAGEKVTVSSRCRRGPDRVKYDSFPAKVLEFIQRMFQQLEPLSPCRLPSRAGCVISIAMWRIIFETTRFLIALNREEIYSVDGGNQRTDVHPMVNSIALPDDNYWSLGRMYEQPRSLEQATLVLCGPVMTSEVMGKVLAPGDGVPAVQRLTAENDEEGIVLMKFVREAQLGTY